MKGTFRYSTTGQWLKGNTHIHTTASDGGMKPEDVASMYAGAGYDFLCCTDHWASSNVAAFQDRSPVLWLDGVELDGQDPATGSWYHIVCLGRFTGLKSDIGLVAGIESARRQGAFLILAHPYWSGNTFDDVFRWPFHGVEVYNHVCRWLNGKSDGGAYWNAMLRRNPDVLAFSVDDAHLRPEHPGWNGGWIVANTAGKTAEELLAAIRSGNYYSSCGPDFLDIRLENGAVCIETSPIQFARLVGPHSLGLRLGGFDGKLLSSARFELPADWEYAYLEIEDVAGRRAWTNTLFAGSGTYSAISRK